MAPCGPTVSRFAEIPRVQGSPSGSLHLAMRRLMTRSTTLVLLVFAACLCSAQEEPSTTLKIDVRLVNVFVTVTDQHGAPVGSLNKENFHLIEDGKEQKISVFDRESALPLSIIMAVDTSLSTKKDLPLELASARHFAHTILRLDRRASVYTFSEIVDEVVSLHWRT
jgi:Ca-activated chloride channel family protein